jgi:hypothetical protein
VPSLWQLLSAPNSNRHIQASYQRTMERLLFTLFYGYLGWPPRDIAWLYPDIFAWENDLPSYIAFYTNPAHNITGEDLAQFRSHLNDTFPGPWELEPRLNEYFIWAIRRPISMSIEVSEREIEVRNLSTLEYEEILHGRSPPSRNGYETRTIGKTVSFMWRDIL